MLTVRRAAVLFAVAVISVGCSSSSASTSPAAVATPLTVFAASSLTKAVSKHTAVIAGGNVLITGGLYNAAATGSSEESYAQLNSDGSLGSFNGATGSHTIASAGGKNLFNHVAIAYVDAVGVAHVLVLGGDDVNAPGKKRKEVWFY